MLPARHLRGSHHAVPRLTREPSRLKVCAFWHSSMTSFSRSFRLRYLWLRMRSCGERRDESGRRAH